MYSFAGSITSWVPLRPPRVTSIDENKKHREALFSGQWKPSMVWKNCANCVAALNNQRESTKGDHSRHSIDHHSERVHRDIYTPNSKLLAVRYALPPFEENEDLRRPIGSIVSKDYRDPHYPAYTHPMHPVKLPDGLNEYCSSGTAPTPRCIKSSCQKVKIFIQKPFPFQLSLGNTRLETRTILLFKSFHHIHFISSLQWSLTPISVMRWITALCS